MPFYVMPFQHHQWWRCLFTYSLIIGIVILKLLCLFIMQTPYVVQKFQKNLINNISRYFNDIHTYKVECNTLASPPEARVIKLQISFSTLENDIANILGSTLKMLIPCLCVIFNRKEAIVNEVVYLFIYRVPIGWFTS